MKKTEFFDGSVHPARPGVYQRRRPQWNHLSNRPPKLKITYALFDGMWHCEAITPRAASRIYSVSHYQDCEWRGLKEQA